MVCQCLKCHILFRFTSSNTIFYNSSDQFSVNIGAVLGQIATGGGADHLTEQLTCVQVPSLSSRSFIQMERSIGTTFEAMVGENLLIAGQKEKQLAIEQGDYHNGIPAITVVVDGGWSKRSHKHTYNANSGVGVIYGAATKALLYIGVRNKYCSLCAISTRNDVTAPPHQCYRNWSGSSCSMEADIILEGFRQSENMHGLRYLWLVGDGDSSVYHSVVTGVPSYGRDITKVKCANDTVKCYRNLLEALCNDKPLYRGKYGLSQAMMKRITHGARCAIKMHSTTSNITALRHDLRNGPHHYFGLHDQCNSVFCKQKSKESTGTVIKYIDLVFQCYLPITRTSPLDKLPPDFLRDVEAAGDRLVSKAAQLIQNKTTNITENFMSIRCKMDGANFTTESSLDPFSIGQWLLHYEYSMVQGGQHPF